MNYKNFLCTLCAFYALFINFHINVPLLGSDCGIEANVLDCDIVVNVIEFQRFHVHFLTNTLRKGVRPLIPPSYKLDYMR